MVDYKVNKPEYLKYASVMVNSQIRDRGITDPRLLATMQKVPRHLFASGFDCVQAYGDFPLPIGHSQTISQPYIVAYMTNMLNLMGKERVLEIGTGSGYQTCVLAEMAAEVYTVETIPSLSEKARKLLNSLGYSNISFRNDDGSAGWEAMAPYDRIIVTAALPRIPEILKNQLVDTGILVAPVGDYQSFQTLCKIERVNTRFTLREDIQCRFVPVLGKYGF